MRVVAGSDWMSTVDSLRSCVDGFDDIRCDWYGNGKRVCVPVLLPVLNLSSRKVPEHHVSVLHLFHQHWKDCNKQNVMAGLHLVKVGAVLFHFMILIFKILFFSFQNNSDHEKRIKKKKVVFWELYFIFNCFRSYTWIHVLKNIFSRIWLAELKLIFMSLYDFIFELYNC